jgi:DNA-directed RNA polymerase specialized sigma24 family protein
VLFRIFTVHSLKDLMLKDQKDGLAGASGQASEVEKTSGVWPNTNHGRLEAYRNGDDEVRRGIVGELFSEYLPAVEVATLASLSLHGDVCGIHAKTVAADFLTEAFLESPTLMERFEAERLVEGGGKTKFRKYLRSSLSNYLIDEYRKQSSLRRGGAYLAERTLNSGDQWNLEDLRAWNGDAKPFDVAWANVILVSASMATVATFNTDLERELFDECVLGENKEKIYSKLSARYGKKPDALKQQAHRIRNKHRAFLRACVEASMRRKFLS